MTSRGPTMGLPELSAYLGVHYMTAYRYVRTGRLPANLVGGAWRIDVGEALAFRESRRVRGSGDVPGSPAGHRPERRRRDRAGGGAAGPPGSVEMLERRLVAGDEGGSFALCEAALSSWAGLGDIYTEMLVPAMRKVGEGWERGELSVADEHRATATVLRLAGHLGPRSARRGPKTATVVVGSASGDHHALPSVVVSDLLRAAGYGVAELGPDVPPEAFVAAAHRSDRLIAVAVGTTLPSCADQVATAVEAIHAELDGVPVIAGGAGLATPRAGRESGADLWSGTDGRRVVELINRLTGRDQPGAVPGASSRAGRTSAGS